MANNGLTVVVADESTVPLRDEDVGGFHAEVVFVHEGPEAIPTLTGGTVRYTVDNSPVVALDPPDAGARYARLRVYETTDRTLQKRLYYRSDGTDPTANGANAFGYLLNGESLLVRLRNPANFKMIADGTDLGTFEVYVEWLNAPSS